MKKLKDQVAIITGCTGEIGQAIAKTLANAGAHIMINYYHPEKEEKAIKLAEYITSTYKVESPVYRVDATKKADLKKMVESVFEKYHHIDILINNVGIVNHDLFLSMDYNTWDHVIKTNLYSSFLCSQLVAKYFIIQKKGVIINISSKLAAHPIKGAANYITSKGGLESFTRALSVELAQKGIRINAIAPGIIESKMSEQLRSRYGDSILQAIPMRRFGTTNEVAKVVLFLASDDSSYITGEVISVAGGY